MGANVIAIDLAADKLAFARDVSVRWPSHQCNADCPDVVSEIQEITQGRRACVDGRTRASPVTSFNSIACLRRRGRHLQVGLMLGDHARAANPDGQGHRA